VAAVVVAEAVTVAAVVVVAAVVAEDAAITAVATAKRIYGGSLFVTPWRRVDDRR